MKKISSVDIVVFGICLVIFAAIIAPIFIPHKKDLNIRQAATNINVILDDLNVYYLSRQRLSKMQDISVAIPPVNIAEHTCLSVVSVGNDNIEFNIDDKFEACEIAWKMSKYYRLKERIVRNKLSINWGSY